MVGFAIMIFANLGTGFARTPIQFDVCRGLAGMGVAFAREISCAARQIILNKTSAERGRNPGENLHQRQASGSRVQLARHDGSIGFRDPVNDRIVDSCQGTPRVDLLLGVSAAAWR